MLAIEGIRELLVKKTSPNKLVFLGELISSGKNQRVCTFLFMYLISTCNSCEQIFFFIGAKTKNGPLDLLLTGYIGARR